VNFNEKKVIVTGAGQGIGKAIAQRFLHSGASVVIADLHVGHSAGLIKDFPKTAVFCKTDLSVEEKIKALMQFTQERFGGLDFIINNARPKIPKTEHASHSSETLLDGWQIGMDVLLKAPALMAKHALKLLEKSSSPAIVNLVSTNAIFIAPQPMVYHVAKAGLIQMTRYLAYTLGSSNIRVNAVAPGIVDVPDSPKPLTSVPVNKKTAEIAVPLQRAASVEEIASSVLFLCSEESTYITGQVLTVDGGITLGDQFHVVRKALNSQGFS